MKEEKTERKIGKKKIKGKKGRIGEERRKKREEWKKDERRMLGEGGVVIRG